MTATTNKGEARCHNGGAECGRGGWICGLCVQDREDARCVARMASDILSRDCAGVSVTGEDCISEASRRLRLAREAVK